MKYLFSALGLLFAGIGAAGAFVPILPTVPFFLLASFCFSQSSYRFNNWLRSTNFYKNHLESFEKTRSMTLKTKLAILIPVTAMLSFAFCMINRGLGRAAIIILLIAKYYFFAFKIKTIPSSDAATEHYKKT